MDSRDLYTNSFVINYKEGGRSLHRDKLIHIEDINDRPYTIKEGDTLTALAYRFYGNSLLWYIIADINDDVIDNPLKLTPGTDIIIPNHNNYI